MRRVSPMPSADFVLRASRVGLAASVLAAGLLHAQSAGLKPGCWDVRMEINTIIMPSPQNTQALEAQKLPSLDQLMQQTLADLSPEQRARVDVAQLRQEIKGSLEASRKALEQAEAVSRKPIVAQRVSNAVRCSANPLSDLRIAAGDVQHADAEHFKATQRQSAPNGRLTVTTVAKWVSEAGPHMPYSPPPTDLDGHRAEGPHAVMWLDQNRIVAVIDGQRITALEAYLILNLPPRHATQPDVYRSGWSSALQHNYMYWAIADQFDPNRKRPPRDKAILGVFSSFNTGSDEGAAVDTRVSNYHYIGNDMQELEREQRLWGIYLSGATTASEKQRLAEQAADKFKVSVVDPDFFAGQPGP